MTIYKQWRRNAWSFFTYDNGAAVSLTQTQAEAMLKKGTACITVRDTKTPPDNVVPFRPLVVS